MARDILGTLLQTISRQGEQERAIQSQVGLTILRDKLETSRFAAGKKMEQSLSVLNSLRKEEDALDERFRSIGASLNSIGATPTQDYVDIANRMIGNMQSRMTSIGKQRNTVEQEFNYLKSFQERITKKKDMVGKYSEGFNSPLVQDLVQYAHGPDEEYASLSAHMFDAQEQTNARNAWKASGDEARMAIANDDIKWKGAMSSVQKAITSLIPQAVDFEQIKTQRAATKQREAASIRGAKPTAKEARLENVLNWLDGGSSAVDQVKIINGVETLVKVPTDAELVLLGLTHKPSSLTDTIKSLQASIYNKWGEKLSSVDQATFDRTEQTLDRLLAKQVKEAETGQVGSQRVTARTEEQRVKDRIAEEQNLFHRENAEQYQKDLERILRAPTIKGGIGGDKEEEALQDSVSKEPFLNKLDAILEKKKGQKVLSPDDLF